MARVLIVDDEAKLGKLLAELLEEAGHDVERATDGKDALDRIRQGGLDLVVSDLRMPGADGMTVLKTTREVSPDTDVILMTAFATAQNAVDAMKQGAADYLIKPISSDEFRLRTGRVLERRALSVRAKELARRLGDRDGFARIVARSPKMQAVLSQAAQVAKTDATVLLLGESGTGKTLLARAIHYGSERAEGPLVEVHCAALPETLLESELFGREKGAYTGATDSRAGHAETAHGGTLFLDEIGEIPPSIQVKLLRFLQDKEFVRLGSTQVRKADVRVVAATNRDLQAAIKEGRFREDLFYRLNVFPIDVPPLRERRPDIRDLALAFLVKRGVGENRLAPETLARLEAYDWPGNARELENVFERALILAGADPITPQHLPASVRGVAPAAGGTGSLDDLLVPGFNLSAHELELINHAIDKAGGNKAAAARLLGISRRRLYSRIKVLTEETATPDDED